MSDRYEDQNQPQELPNEMELEQHLLGTLMLRSETLHSVSAYLEPEYFYEPVHGDIYRAIVDIVLRGSVATPIAVKMQMERPDRKIGRLTMGEYLASLAANSTGPSAIIFQAMGVRELYNRRHLIHIGQQLVEVGMRQGDPVVLVDQAGEAINAIGQVTAALEDKVSFAGDNLAASYLASITMDPDKKVIRGVPIVLREIGTVLSESMFEAGNLYGMLSSSGEGKSSLTMQILFHAAMAGHPTCFLSYDQTGEQCVAQIVAQNTGIEARRQKARDLTEKNVDEAYAIARRLAAAPFEIIQCSSDKDDAEKIAGKAKRFLKRYSNGKTPFFAVDHMSAIRPLWEDRNADEGSKARNTGQKLKDLAKTTNSAVLVLQQRSGAGMKRKNPRPTAADLYGGEGARQPFDGIFYLFRAEEHKRRQLEIADDAKQEGLIETTFGRMFPEGIPLEGTAEIGALKVRFGKNGIKRYLNFTGERTLYETRHRQINDEQDALL